MADPLQQLSETLKSSRQSLTEARKSVFTALLENDPLSMTELVNRCQDQADRASVYRTVNLYEQLGIIHRLQTGWKYKLELSDSFQRHHHHMHCTGCDQIFSLPEDRLMEERLQQLAAGQGFRPESHQIEIRGLCRNCQKPSA